MKQQTFRRWCVLVLACMALATVLSAQTTTTRNLSEFLNAQGTYCLFGSPCYLIIPPVSNFIGSSDLTGQLMSVDYAGLVNRCWPTLNLPTSFDGTIIERPLKDGRAEVEVILHTSNALTWVTRDDWAAGPVLFGQRWNSGGTCRVQNSSGLSNPVLGDSFMHLVFTNPRPGYPLPDLIQLFFFPESGQGLTSTKVHAKAFGPLYNLPGILDGTPGEASTQQIGLVTKTHGKAAIDGFTVERIDLKPVGKK